MKTYNGHLFRNGLEYQVAVAVKRKTDIRDCVLRQECLPLISKSDLKQWAETKDPVLVKITKSKPGSAFARMSSSFEGQWRELVIDQSGVYFI